ncbi:MAG: hypothetical protein AVDCRST_MAG21-1650 [uncultured Nocardioidaceae bacterium]|uniref:Uncharacterized protein n=1 Tax=uncultured Nocardioidaceae bacterium TaxID=253824 RepID=A0A6J4N5S9_9ACTN|nr:MAG: hypothetical protein AVDCRST_MAG21-1650 [uncultured Nocardioidaceae bacterium]
MKSAYRILAYLVAAGVVVQAADIAFAWFTAFSDMDSGTVVDENYRNTGHTLHGIMGMMVIPVLALVLLVVSFFAKVPDGVKWAASVFGVVVLQVALAFLAFGVTPALGALHGLNAMLLLGVSVMAGHRVGRHTVAHTPSTETHAGQTV